VSDIYPSVFVRGSRYLDHDGEVSGDGRMNSEDEGHDGEGHRPAALTRHTCQRRTVANVYRLFYNNALDITYSYL